jgi:hypothetical protein
MTPFEGSGLDALYPTFVQVALRTRKADMTTETLKRKLRNFPAANLSLRIASATV